MIIVKNLGYSVVGQYAWDSFKYYLNLARAKKIPVVNTHANTNTSKFPFTVG